MNQNQTTVSTVKSNNTRFQESPVEPKVGTECHFWNENKAAVSQPWNQHHAVVSPNHEAVGHPINTTRTTMCLSQELNTDNKESRLEPKLGKVDIKPKLACDRHTPAQLMLHQHVHLPSPSPPPRKVLEMMLTQCKLA